MSRVSALPPIADMCGAQPHVCFGPKADMALLFDNVIGAGKYRRRNCEAHCLGGFEIDCQFVLGRCLHREVSRPLTLEDAVNITSGPTVVVDEIGSIRY